ncbi:5'-3' exonuclease [Thermaerobacillus caldiproteolyticus]|uniref:5'-3' exonuclease n=1 Tax=Thermaerobacillus caldiproteolyticus TaxID=247480 RepID=A0A7V9Z711_9BACL|nr:5'-3' exonuclease H3TH domain-containing protein [Anoxybacillus caldiproteolyticus]MBA2875113.1 5'-3' exonuclease [Anoxybacillus caldiproteolyticus]
MKGNDRELLLIDGMALLFRSFYATAINGDFMFNSQGIPTNAIHGFVKHLIAAVRAIGPTHVVCCWDMGSTTFRTEMFPQYKANRGEPPLELVPQFELVKEVVSAFDIPNIGVLGAEADDCIGTLTKQWETKMNISILTGDQDILQLLSEMVTVYLLGKGIGNYNVYTLERFQQEKGILPRQFIDVKALMGDASDNYPGVRGIGEKTALKLVQQYGSIEGILENIHLLTESQRQKLREHLDMLHLSRKLAKIYCDIPIALRLEEAKWEANEDKVQQIFDHLELKGLDKLINV